MIRSKAMLASALAAVAVWAIAPLDASAASHYTKAQCRQYQQLGRTLGLSNKAIQQGLRQHGCIKKKKKKK